MNFVAFAKMEDTAHSFRHGGLFIFNRAYLDPYTSIQGQLILSCILVMFATAIVLMHNMSHIQAPERFIRRRLVVVR